MQNEIARAIARREALIAEAQKTPHPKGAFRLFDGFREGGGRFQLDVYGSTLVVFDHAPADEQDDAGATAVVESVRAALPFLKTAIHKHKSSRELDRRRGRVVVGSEKDVCKAIEEDGVRYVVRLLVHHDASFYLDTRNLRSTLRSEAAGKRVLNAFAYTGSIGVAARAAPAAVVVQTDKNKELLNVGKDSYAKNGFEVDRSTFIAGDFFDVVARLRKNDELYDWVIVDPPLFADSAKGRVDVVESIDKLIDKVRPLVGDGGRLVVVNNALFVSGAEFEKTLEAVCAGGYAKVERRIPVPDDCAPPLAEGCTTPADPSPFNHPTKIAVLQMSRRDGRKA